MMERGEFARLLTRFLSKYDRFLLSGHVRPDGDAIGAVTALGLLIRHMGKEAMIVTDGDASRYTDVLPALPMLPEDVSVLDAGKHFQTGSSFAFILLDCSEPKRTGRGEEAIMAAACSLSIDHHITAKEACNFSYCEPETSSTCEILFGLFELMGVSIDRDMANALFMGIAYDTGGFRHSNTAAATFRAGAKLKEFGADSTFLMNYLFYTCKMAEAKCFSAAVKNAKIYEGGLLFSCLSLAELSKMGASSHSADGVVGKLMEIEEATVCVFLREIEPGLVRANMRSKGEIDVSRVASIFGGGGHMKAAGCNIQGPLLYAQEEIMKAIHHQLEEKGE